tara:strand:+ start:1625 stop:2701 length:1077 start_codon:yes stop_codon:yes gene_type:complete
MLKNSLNTNNLVNNFISKSKGFYEDLEMSSIDDKHQEIIKNAYSQVSNISKNFNYRSWKDQGDLSLPAQFSIKYLIYQPFPRSILKLIFRLLFKRTEDYFLSGLIEDEVNIINSIGGKDLLAENPVHLSPDVEDVYSIQNTTVNIRWLRYIYILCNILTKNLISENGTWVDVGSYYGGLQGLVKKYKPNSKIIMVDFNHQLCRSYVYLSKLYPNNNHILPDEFEMIKDFSKIKNGSFIYVPVNKYNLIQDQKVDLVSNFFSLGEMRRNFFLNYYESKLFQDSLNAYIVNRYVSAPYFDKTYDSDLTVLDYITNTRQIKYFSEFPMTHYLITKRKLFGKSRFRNVSSNYFELISSKKND